MNGITRDRTNHCETPSTVPSMIPAAAEAATAPGLSAVAAPTIAGPMNPADSPAVTTTTHLIHTPPAVSSATLLARRYDAKRRCDVAEQVECDRTEERAKYRGRGVPSEDK